MVLLLFPFFCAISSGGKGEYSASPSPLLFILPQLSSAPQSSRYSLCVQGSGCSPWPSLSHPSTTHLPSLRAPAPISLSVFTFTALWSASSPAKIHQHSFLPHRDWLLCPRRCFKAHMPIKVALGLQEGLGCKNSVHQDPDHCLAWPGSP